MKTFLTAILISFTLAAQAQDEHAIPREKWLKDFFISDAYCASKGLEPGETRQSFRVWNYKNTENRIQRVVDVRWCLESPEQARAYLNENYVKMSENGEPLDTKVTLPFAENVMVYRESKEARTLNEGLGLHIRMYYFLFTLKNYVAKVFVSSEKDLSLTEAADFAREAATRLNAAVK